MEDEEITSTVEKINELLENRKMSDLRQLLETIKSADFPYIFDEIDEEQIIIVFRLLSKEKAADVFIELDSDRQEHLIGYLSDKEIKNVMNELFMDDAADLIEEMPSNVVNRILANTKAEDRKIINELLKYPDDTAGSLMTTEFVYLKVGTTVKDSFEVIKEKGLQKETIYNCYVVEENKKLVGSVDIKDLLLAEEDVEVSTLMDTSVIKVQTLEDQEDVSKLFDKYDIVAAPVVDNEEKLVGIITIDDILEVIKDESEEDFNIMNALAPNENTYFKTSVFTHAKHRILWLLLLMISATFSGTILAHYEAAIAALPVLVAFVPMLMDTGGNCGSQSATLIIRGLATDTLSSKDVFKIIWKEIRVSFLVGIVLGLINGTRIAIQYSSSIEMPNTSILIGFVVGFTLVFVVLAANLIGGVLPIIAKKLKFDPALMSSPIITTIMDSFSLSIFFYLATKFLVF